MKTCAKITPEGTRDLLFEECKAHRQLEGVLIQLFEDCGYNEVQTPGLEFFDVFNCGAVSMAPEIMYKLTDRKGRLMVLRPDCTTPIARLAATRLQHSDLPLRMFYNQHVFRVTPDMTGHKDQFTQAGIELIGAAGHRADLEVIVMAIDALQKCRAPSFILELGHVGLFESLASKLPADEEVIEQVRVYIEGKNYAALNDLLDTMENSPAVKAVRALPRLFGGEEVFETAKQILGNESSEPIQYLQKIYTDLCKLGLNGNIRIDLGLVHQRHYYTGVIFRGYMRGYGDTVLSGGRYDNLLSAFGVNLPATGFGLNLDLLVTALLERGEVKPPVSAQVLVYGEDGFEIEALCHIRTLVEDGYTCENSVFDSINQTMAYAKKHGIPRVDIVSDSFQSVKTGEEIG